MMAADLADFAHQLADAAAVVTLAGFRGGQPVRNKSAHGFDPQSAADRQAEAVMRQMIEARYPAHGIEGEEEGDKAAQTGESLRWILDPIDGTKYYLGGAYGWGTLIGLYDGSEPLFGLCDHPAAGERFYGGCGQSWRAKQGQKERLTARGRSLPQAVLAATSPDMFRGGEEKCFAALAARAAMVLYGGNCHFYSLLAAGRIDMVVESNLKPCDILPLVPILESAGAVITGWDGKRLPQGGRVVAAASKDLHAAALAILQEA